LQCPSQFACNVLDFLVDLCQNDDGRQTHHVVVITLTCSVELDHAL